MSTLKTLFKAKPAKDDGEHWLSVSDLMSGLMIVFLFIAIAFMRHTQNEKKKIEDVAVAYQQNQVAIFNELNQEFEKDLETWKASIDKETLSFQFNSPEVLFDKGSSKLNGQFRTILDSFIPRYLNVLEKFRTSIDEVRIEGHTSSEWDERTSPDIAYFKNMELSQDRTRSVLDYAYFNTSIDAEKQNWIKTSFAAVGLSSSRLKIDAQGQEDSERSRRVSFRVITNADIQIRQILQSSVP